MPRLPVEIPRPLAVRANGGWTVLTVAFATHMPFSGAVSPDDCGPILPMKLSELIPPLLAAWSFNCGTIITVQDVVLKP